MIGRARIALLVALIAGIVITATEFPLGQLMRGRAEVAAAGQQLSRLQAENRALAAEVSSLHQAGTVARIAHQEYGLIANGQRSVVVLPSSPAPRRPGAGAGGSALGSKGFPKSDLVPSDVIVSPSGGATGDGRKRAGFWERVVQRLEFWRALP